MLPLQAVLLGIELIARYDTLERQIALAVTNVVGTGLLIFIGSRFIRAGSRLPAAVSWLAVAAIWFDAAGNFAHLYANIAWWDKLAHVVGTAAVAGAVWLSFKLFLENRRLSLPAFHHWLYAVSVAMLLAGLYEVSEYVGDWLFDTVRVTDLYDTADDLLWNFLAAAGAAWYFAARFQKPFPKLPTTDT
ncbi:MAG: hypothetical protein HYZ09_04275 [Candidatus Kerfeldbacteria bacterium]|nr:hypothetical protein [Candidatus Kerfeldbacteria bacterium]